jgi:hypothetical protein
VPCLEIPVLGSSLDTACDQTSLSQHTGAILEETLRQAY